MRISELSRRSDVSIPTIKYYLREGLLPAGQSTVANQASYDEGHAHRLKLIRAMIDVGGVSIAAAREVLAAVDSDAPLARIFGVAQSAASAEATASAPLGAGLDRTRQVIADRKWTVHDSNPGLARTAAALDAFDALEHAELVDLVDGYATAAEIVAEADLRAVATQPNRSRMTSTVVVGTLLGDALFAGLRRMAQEHRTHQLFPAPGDVPDCGQSDDPRPSDD